MNGSKKYIVFGLLIIAIASTGIAGFLIARNFISFKNSNGLPSENPVQSQVLISNPDNGFQLLGGESVLVEALAIGPEPFLSIELWVDGELAAVQAAPSIGLNPFSTFFYWTPTEPGIHSLIATSINNKEQKSYSGQVLVFVILEESYAGLQEDSPVAYPAPGGGGYSPPASPDEDQPVSPSNDWKGSLGNWITSLSAIGKPTAPELVVTQKLCGANLSIRDLSDNETGFIVYRQTTNSSFWNKIGMLSAQSTSEWLAFTDDNAVGFTTYYVSSYNSQGESASNLAVININPADCPEETGKLKGITVEVTKLLPELASDMSYCYKSIDGVNWTRWPELGFLPLDEASIITGGPVVQVIPDGFNGQGSSETMDLFLECWGWGEGDLRFLGNVFVEDLEIEYFGSQVIPGNQLQAEVQINQVEVEDQLEFFPTDEENFSASEFSQQGPNYPSTFLHPEIPGIVLSTTTSPEKCLDHLPLWYQNPDGQEAFCWTYPEYLSMETTQPFLVWYHQTGSFIDFTCFGGPEVCKTYNELIIMAKETGGQVGIDLRAVTDVGTYNWTVTEPYLSMFVVPPLTCTEMEFVGRLWYQPGLKQILHQEGTQISQPDIRYGPWSNWAHVPCAPDEHVEPYERINVTFKTLGLSNTDDGGDINSLEIYGYFRVTAPAMGYEVPNQFNPSDTVTLGTRRYFNLATWDEQGDECPDDSHDWFTSPGSGCPPQVFAGSYNLSTLELCHGTSRKYCKTGFVVNNNTQEVIVNEGDSLALEVKIMDWDDASSNDLVCEGSIITPSKSLADWADTQTETYTLTTSTTDSGQCTIQVELNAISP